MAKRSIHNVKLGVFVLSGLLFLVLILYMIGKNSNLFGDTYELRARFPNIQGLVVGNNVRYAGIETGTVKKIQILNDTVIEVTLVIEEKMKSIIRKNSLVTIGTEGLVGNKVINILPASPPGDFAEENDILYSLPSVDTDKMLQTLDQTNKDIAVIAEDLKKTIENINNSASLWSLLNDKSVPYHIQASLANIHEAARNANAMTSHLNTMVSDIQNGKGSVGSLLTDTTYARDLHQILQKLQTISSESDALISEMDTLVKDIHEDIQEGPGPLNSILKDSMVFRKVHSSLENIEKGTEQFNVNMEALKHNFLFRGYFKKQARQEKRKLEKSN